MRIQSTEEKATQKRNETENGDESTETTIDPPIPDSTGINNSNMERSWGDFSTDDEHMDTPNNSSEYNEARGEGSNDQNRIEETTIIFKHSTESELGYNNAQIDRTTDTTTTDDHPMEPNTKTDKENNG